MLLLDKIYSRVLHEFLVITGISCRIHKKSLDMLGNLNLFMFVQQYIKETKRFLQQWSMC
jgi:hypothetical protein